MSYTRLRVEVEGKIGNIILSQPDEFNRMPPAFWQEFPRAVQELDARGDIRALIISAEGKHFTSGMDTTVFTGPRGGGSGSTDRGRNGEGAPRGLSRLMDAFGCMERVRMPVIAAVQGACIGAGVDMMSALDMRYATEDAFFCIQEINIGMAADVGTMQRLPHIIPDAIMRELAYTGRRLYAAEAKEIGLVNAVFPTHGDMMDHVNEVALQIASKSPLAIVSTKHLLHYVRDHSVEDALDYQKMMVGAMPQGAEMAKYFGAKAEGKEAEFEDLLPITDASLI